MEERAAGDRPEFAGGEEAGDRQAGDRLMERLDIVAGREMGVSQRRAELEELYDAVVLGKPLWHDARWGMATLEVCLAMLQSAKERREIMLRHQVAVPDGYDADLEFPGI